MGQAREPLARYTVQTAALKLASAAAVIGPIGWSGFDVSSALAFSPRAAWPAELVG
jgi:hypothetical protein